MHVHFLFRIFYTQEYFDQQEAHRSTVMTSLVRKYHAISPLLIKVEGLVVYSNTGKSYRLKQYYAYWEKRIFDSLIKVPVVLYILMYVRKVRVKKECP